MSGAKPSKYPSTFYRVSLKAVIKDSDNRVLVVKEKGSGWTLPGGGLDHGESAMQGLARELLEEVGYTDKFSAELDTILPIYATTKQAWMLWVVYSVETESQDFSLGVDADDIAFMDPTMFKKSLDRAERLVYKMCVDRSADF